MKKIADIMESRGNTSGFDYLRVFLAIAVLCIHSFATSYGRPAEAFLFIAPWRGFTVMVLPVFFALSGFLVTGSYFRTRDIRAFLALRILRIVPALSVEVFLCALVLGAIFTTLPLRTYFSSSLFWSYFGNTIGYIHFLLPGVFEDNPLNIAVNISLWTVPYELECYVALILLATAGIIRWRWTFAALLVAAHVGLYARSVLRGFDLPIDGALPPRLLVLSFVSGVAVYVFRDRLPMNGWSVFGALLLSVLMLGNNTAAQFAPPIVAYATAGIGLTNPARTALIDTGDYSYGIYLYAFPIQQTFVHLFPSLREWYWNILFSLPATFLFAVFSWHAVEKHFLKLKKYVGRRRSSLLAQTRPA